MTEWWIIASSILMTSTLALLAFGLGLRGARKPIEQPGVWGAATASGSLAGLSGFQTAALLIPGFAASPFAQAALRVTAVAGIVLFWINYRRAEYVLTPAAKSKEEPK